MSNANVTTMASSIRTTVRLCLCLIRVSWTMLKRYKVPLLLSEVTVTVLLGIRDDAEDSLFVVELKNELRVKLVRIAAVEFVVNTSLEGLSGSEWHSRPICKLLLSPPKRSGLWASRKVSKSSAS